MAPKHFNPFEDRLSRDIRNDLSESLLEVIAEGDLAPAWAVVRRYDYRNLPEVYHRYIVERLKRYATALPKLTTSADGLNDDCLLQAAVLWDLELFFEVHEILEPQWIRATGDRKKMLQALIRAAGAYIHLEAGAPDRAAKIAGKALPILKQFRQRLSETLAVESLISALKTSALPPPPLFRDDG